MILPKKKLISQSKLINMYYEINNNESCKTMQHDVRRSNEEDESSDKFLNNISKTNNINNEKDITNCIMTPDGQIICKSEPNFPSFRKTNCKNISDNDSNSADLLNKKEMLKKGGNKGKKTLNQAKIHLLKHPYQMKQ